MIEDYMMEKFIERVKVLEYGFGYKLVKLPDKLKKFVNSLCEIPFRSNVSFRFSGISDSYINLKGIIEENQIPFKVDIKILDKIEDGRIPYKLSDYQNNIEEELAFKINNIMSGEINMLDLYDIYMYFTLRYNEIDEEILFNMVKGIDYRFIKKIDNQDIRNKWREFKCSIPVSFDNLISVLEKIVILSEKVLV